MRLLDRVAIRFHILDRAVSDVISEQQMSRELFRRDYRVGPGNLRQILDDLVAETLLTQDQRVIDGTMQNIYRATPAGKMELARDRRLLSKLTHEVFGDAIPPAPSGLVVDAPGHSVLSSRLAVQVPASQRDCRKTPEQGRSLAHRR
ncbi:helix-turn-helix transcriptional regulator [Williamsia sp. 1135]|uniref:helix-turn-helix transcriptional regulator n=1 Tax=Williamsia sp. 1135 TaxID=1889262 RepID=UPI00117FF5A1|nr:helix-turn-helix transcriptional regulator [Williamsia sp. 1135]